MRIVAIAALVVLSLPVSSNPVLEMNEAFSSLSELIPYVADEERFTDKKNERFVQEKLSLLSRSIKNAKHDSLLKQDIFAPSYALLTDHLENTQRTFGEGKKVYALNRMKELTSLCIDCHTRLPPEKLSSYSDGTFHLNPKTFGNTYNLAIGELLTRQYTKARGSFQFAVNESFVSKNYAITEKALKQILLIEMKILKEDQKMLAVLDDMANRKDLPPYLKDQVREWKADVLTWSKRKEFRQDLSDEKEAKVFITGLEMLLKPESSVLGKGDVHLLTASGILSRFMFNTPESSLAPEINYWLGWMELRLKRDHFFCSGDFFLKQCIRRYPKSPVAPNCLRELKEDVTFQYSGSSGTHIPEDVSRDLKALEKLIEK
jgi:hypothetical protein